MTSPADIIKYAIDSRLANVNTCLPGRVISFDFEKSKASIQPSLKKRLLDGQIFDLPIINNVPVIFPRSGSFSMTFPIKQGDYVLVLFSQRSLDLWLSVGGVVAPDDFRKFDLSDAIAIPGILPFSETSQAEDNENFILNFGDSKLKITPEGTICFHGASEELMDIIDELFGLLEAATIASFGTPFVNVADFIALRARFNTLKGTC